MKLLVRITGFFSLNFRSSSRLQQRFSSTMVQLNGGTPFKSVFDHIPKSPQDNRTYRGLVLHNDLKVLLVSDPSTEKAAASFDVHVGCMQDPWKLQGLAHFLEHMLFMGTEKYPDENAFEKYVSDHGGQYNAYTCEEHTNYHFDVAADYLEPSLDRFAQFFIAPLLTESSTEREVNAVNSEHENNLTSDSRRLDHLSRCTADPEHDFNKFGTGSKDTLWFNPAKEGINVREQLLEFHQKWYSSNISSLVVLGKESLELLTEMVCKMFLEVPNKQVEIPKWDQPPFKPEHLKLQLKVVPVKDVRSLNMVWPIPDLDNYYKSKPGHYLGGLLGHEGPGSLLSALKAKGWSNTLHAGEEEGAKGFAFFMVGVDLTEEGLEHTDDIVTMVFEYLHMLREVGPQQWIWEEERQLMDIKFRFRDKDKPISAARNYCALLHKYPLSEVLTGPSLMEVFEPKIISEILTHLTPDRMRISVCSQSFKNIATEKEPIYGIDYLLEKIPEERIAGWKEVGNNPQLALPKKNEFIPTQFDILPPSQAIHRMPVLTRRTDYSRLWYLQDIEHRLPKAVTYFEINSPVVYQDSLHANAAHLYIELFKDAVNEMVYAADLAGLKYILEQSKYGATLSVRGYDDKVDVLLKMLMDKLVHFKPTKERFDVMKEVYGRQLRNFYATEPNRQSMWYFNVIMSEVCFTKEQLIKALDDLTFDKMAGLMADIFKNVYVEGFVYGNVNRAKAESFLDIVENSLKDVGAKPMSDDNRLRLLQLRDGTDMVYHQTNKVHKSSSVTSYFQCSFEDKRHNMLVELYEQIVNEPCFDILRTKEQLGYIVYSSVKNVSGVLGLQVLVQSNRSPTHVDGRIENFLVEMHKFIKEMPEEEFQTHIEALAVRRLEKPKTIYQQASKFWNEIYVRQYNFDRDNEEVHELRTITKDELVNFMNEYLMPGGAKRKKLTIHITSTVPGAVKSGRSQSRKRRAADSDGQNGDAESAAVDGNAMETEAESEPVQEEKETTVKKMEVISDLDQFKKECGFCPLPPKYVDVHKIHGY